MPAGDTRRAESLRGHRGRGEHDDRVRGGRSETERQKFQAQDHRLAEEDSAADDLLRGQLRRVVRPALCR